MNRCVTNLPMQREAPKAGFSRRLAKDKHIRACHQAKREPGIWQHRMWGENKRWSRWLW